ncbi:MAG: transposase, partial [Planctomycetota bacterium]|nr:transposase [Planctomycetota bacterium]
MRKTYPAVFKMKVALEAVSGQRSIAELASRHEVSAKVVGDWKKQLLS